MGKERRSFPLSASIIFNLNNKFSSWLIKKRKASGKKQQLRNHIAVCFENYTSLYLYGIMVKKESRCSPCVV